MARARLALLPPPCGEVGAFRAERRSAPGGGPLPTAAPHPLHLRSRSDGATSPRGGGNFASISISAASIEGLVLGRIGGDGVIARHVGKAAEVDGIGELRLACGELLVAARW